MHSPQGEAERATAVTPFGVAGHAPAGTARCLRGRDTPTSPDSPRKRPPRGVRRLATRLSDAASAQGAAQRNCSGLKHRPLYGGGLPERALEP